MAPDARVVTVTVDGETAQADLHDGGGPGAIVIHGLGADRRELAGFPTALSDAGFTVLNIDLRGHGASEGLRGRLARERVRADLDAWTDALADEHDRELSLLVGHSLGGLWALDSAPRFDVDAVAALASPASVRSELFLLEHAAYRIAGATDKLVRALGGSTIRVPYRVGLEDTLDHPRAIERVAEMDLIQPDVPMINVPDLLAIDGPAWARRVEVPALVAHGCRDTFIPRESTHALYEALPGPKTWMELPGPHSLFLDMEAQECARRVVSWAQDAVEGAGGSFSA